MFIGISLRPPELDLRDRHVFEDMNLNTICQFRFSAADIINFKNIIISSNDKCFEMFFLTYNH